jgi:hypothetical protein
MDAGAADCAMTASPATRSNPRDIAKVANRYRIVELLAPSLSFIGLNLQNEVHRGL